MVRWVLLASLALAVAADPLTYRGKAGASIPVQGDFTFTLDLTGDPALIQDLRASNPILAVQQLRVSRKGRRTISQADGNSERVDVVFDSGHAEGRANDNAFQFDLAGVPAAADQLRMISWGLGLGPRRFTLSSAGDYRLADPSADGQAEAMGIIVDAPVRLADHAVTVGEEWTTQWSGSRQVKDGVFRYSQTAKLVEMIDGPPAVARVSFTTTGTLDIPSERNVQLEETRLESKGAVSLDLTTGLVTSADSSGVIRTELKKLGLQIVRQMSVTYRPQ